MKKALVVVLMTIAGTAFGQVQMFYDPPDATRGVYYCKDAIYAVTGGPLRVGGIYLRGDIAWIVLKFDPTEWKLVSRYTSGKQGVSQQRLNPPKKGWFLPIKPASVEFRYKHVFWGASFDSRVPQEERGSAAIEDFVFERAQKILKLALPIGKKNNVSFLEVKGTVASGDKNCTAFFSFSAKAPDLKTFQ